jgi:hypothetical protein
LGRCGRSPAFENPKHQDLQFCAPTHGPINSDNQLNSFINQVMAQSGKSLTAAHAALLIQLATALMM